MSRLLSAFSLLLLLIGCMGNRIFHTRVAPEWGKNVPRTASVRGEGVLSDRLQAVLHRTCPGLALVDRGGDLGIVLTSDRDESISLSCYRRGQGTLLFSLSFIITSDSEKAITAVFRDFSTRLDAELRKRFPGYGKGVR